MGIWINEVFGSPMKLWDRYMLTRNRQEAVISTVETTHSRELACYASPRMCQIRKINPIALPSADCVPDSRPLRRFIPADVVREFIVVEMVDYTARAEWDKKLNQSSLERAVSKVTIHTLRGACAHVTFHCLSQGER